MDLSMKTMIAARTTPVPDVGTQVAADMKDTVKNAAENVGDILDRMPQFVSRVLISVAVLIAGLIILKLGKMIIQKAGLRKEGRDPVVVQRSVTRRSIISSVFSYIMFFVIVAAVLSLFGVDVTSLLTAAGVVGIAIAFGAQTMVKDILSGLFIWGEKSYSVGDLINVNGLDGTVESMTIRTTSIRNYNGNVVIIPNGDIRTITNMSHTFKRAIVNVPCPYEENQERLVEMIKEEMEIAAQEVDGIEAVPDVMSIVAFDNNSVRVQVTVACAIGENWRIEREIRTRIKARFDREGIIMPHYTAPEANA